MERMEEQKKGKKKEKKEKNKRKSYMMAEIEAKKEITGVQSKKRVKKEREKEMGDLNSIEYLNFFCLRGVFLRLLGIVKDFLFFVQVFSIHFSN